MMRLEKRHMLHVEVIPKTMSSIGTADILVTRTVKRLEAMWIMKQLERKTVY